MTGFEISAGLVAVFAIVVAAVQLFRVNERDGRIEREVTWRQKAEAGERQAHKEAEQWREKHAELRTRIETYLEIDQV